MKAHLQRHVPLLRDASYLNKAQKIHSLLKRFPFLCDLLLLLFVIAMCVGFTFYFERYSEPLQPRVDIDLSPLYLPKYTFFSMSRGLLGYLLSLAFSLVWGIWAAKDRVAERTLIPLLDILQSIPILGFMPGLILFLIALFPSTNMGLELAAIVMIFTSQAWNMTFGVYHSIRIVPQDKRDCATVYRFSSWQKLKWLELPSTVISLVWNSMMSMAGGWFFLMVNEAFKLGDRDFRLPGLGSYMSVAAARGDIYAMVCAILAMIVLIVFLDYFLWKPLVVWSQKFRVEETGLQSLNGSAFFYICTHSWLLKKVGLGLRTISFRSKQKTSHFSLHVGRFFLFVLIGLLIAAVVALAGEILELDGDQWLHLARMCLLTFGRVVCCLLIGAVIAIPLGLWIGLSEKISKKLEPLIQITASFPATLLFPLLIFLFHKAGISLEIGSIVLMLTGTQWYILFNVIAGSKAIPSDLKEVATGFRWKRWMRFTRLYFPATFPYFVTGLVSAAGGAWNASIVAEYISFKGQIWTVPGLGSTISLAAQNGQIPLLVGSILVMSVVVVTLNYQVWLKMYHYSEKRFALNL